MKKSFLLKLVLLLIVNTSYLLSNYDMQKVTLQLSWFNQFQFAGYYMAKEKGFYKNENIDINIKPFDWGVNVSKSVSNGTADFGIGRETLILDTINDYHNLVSLYPLFQVSPLVLLTKKESNITNIKEFVDKKLMATIDDANEVSLKAMIKSNNLDFDKIKFIKHSHNINDLISNKVDIISAYRSKSPYILNKKQIEYRMFAPADYGFDMYSDFLFTNQEFIDKNVHLVESFKRASLKGWEYAYIHIEESVDLILKQYNTQNLTKEELIFEANELKKLSYSKNSILGNIDKSKLRRILDLYRLMGITNESNIGMLDNFIFTQNNSKLTKEERLYLQNKHTLKICIQKNLMPYAQIENNNVQGMVAEYKKLFETKLNINITYVIAKDRNEIFSYLQKNKCDMISTIGNTEDVEELINFTLPYITLPYVAVAKKNKTFISNFRQLKDSTVLISNCRVLNKIIDMDYPFIEKTKMDNFRDAFIQVEKGDADFFIANIAEVVHNMKYYYSDEIQISGILNENDTHGFGLNKEDKILLDILNKTIKNISNVEHDNIISDFTNLKYKEIIDYTFTIKIVLVFTALSLILFFFYKREMALKNKIKKLNITLKDKIKIEVEKNREKDKYLFQQSKLASMGEMIGNIAHQWRQPLNRIILSSQVIDSEVDNSNTSSNNIIKDKISDINKNIHYMSNTIEDYMNYFHPNKEKKQFYFSNTIQKALALLESRTKNMTINADITRYDNINGYENEFTQIILVILNNALDNQEITNKDNFYINIKVEEALDSYLISISDNGGGIHADIIDKIFEPYFTTKFKKEGSGIGLHMAKMIIEQSMHGQINVQSDADICTFEIKLDKAKF